jgi:hypothetical protein
MFGKHLKKKRNIVGKSVKRVCQTRPSLKIIDLKIFLRPYLTNMLSE